jgi:hypothetical protein
VRAQAERILARLGDRRLDLAALVAAEPPDARPALLRDEVARWCALDEPDLQAEALAWIDGVTARDDRADLWHDLATVLLELPPDELERVAAALARGDVAEDVRGAALRFHAPQAERLQAVFERAATSGWSSPAT